MKVGSKFSILTSEAVLLPLVVPSTVCVAGTLSGHRMEASSDLFLI